MKKAVAGILALFIVMLILFNTYADVTTGDLEDMTPVELLALKEEIEKEYSKATKVDNKYEDELKSAFRKVFEEKFPNAQSFSYPLFGLSIERARAMYKVSGNCAVKFSDKSKLAYAVSAYFWLDETSNEMIMAFMLLDNEVVCKDKSVIPNIARYFDQATYTLIEPYLEGITGE